MNQTKTNLEFEDMESLCQPILGAKVVRSRVLSTSKIDFLGAKFNNGMDVVIFFMLNYGQQWLRIIGK